MTRIVTFPDGTRVAGGRIADAVRDAREAPPDLGLYAHGTGRPSRTALGAVVNRLAGRPIHAGSWSPPWQVRWVAWPDMGVPTDGPDAAAAIVAAFHRASAGDRVEVRCLGGQGRTGTMLACMAVLAGVPVEDAVGWVRAAYARGAIERRAQAEWVRWFAEHHPSPRPG